MSLNIRGPVSFHSQPVAISSLGKRSRDGEGSDLSFLSLGDIPVERAPNQKESRMYQNYLEENKVTNSALQSFKSCFINTDIQSMRQLVDEFSKSVTTNTSMFKNRKSFLREMGVFPNKEKIEAFDKFRRCFAANMDHWIWLLNKKTLPDKTALFEARVNEFDNALKNRVLLS